MFNVWEKAIISLAVALVFCFSTGKTLGAMQQSGYKNSVFLRWLKRKDNLLMNRLCVLALCLALASAITSLCFSFLGEKCAVVCSLVPFLALIVAYYFADRKFALKVPTKKTGRAKRLFAVYALVAACVAYLLVAVLDFLAAWNGSALYALIAFVPFAVFPILLPFLLCFANLLIAPFEELRNGKFVKRAGQVLDESKTIKIAVVGSYGKTSVKNVLKTLLQEKYSVVETPESYNTPMGIAKTVFSPAFADKEVFIAEMGARKAGDISELCQLVKPDYALFTGVCGQHVASFGSVENVWQEKSAVLRYPVKKAVCGESVRAYAEKETFGDKVVFADGGLVSSVTLGATETAFSLDVGGEEICVKTKLLGNAAVENILLAATLCKELGLSAEEIARGIGKLESIPHRLQLIEANGAYILDDGYNANPKGAKEAILALQRFSGRKCVVTPGLVECGILEETLNGELGAQIAEAKIDKVLLVGETLVGAVKDGYLSAGGDAAALRVVKTLEGAKEELKGWLGAGDCVLFLNDLPDVY